MKKLIHGNECHKVTLKKICDTAEARAKFLFQAGSLLFAVLIVACFVAADTGNMPPLSVDKAIYAIGDTVAINISINPAETLIYSFEIVSSNQRYTYRGDFNPLMLFYPREEDIYTAALVEKSTGANIYSVSFVVSGQKSGRLSNDLLGSRFPDERARQAQLQQTNASMNSAVNASTVQLTNTANLPGGEPIAEISKSLQNVTVPVNMSFFDAKKERRMAQIKVLSKKNNRYDLEITPVGKDAHVKRIRLNGVNDSSKKGLFLSADGVKLKWREFSRQLKANSVVKSYFIDPTGVDFVDGTVSSVASGNELWKCKDWNATRQECQGVWTKEMNLNPGQEYSVKIGPQDPAYAETGVASINTEKAIYRPNETARVLIAVLDTSGRLVPGAAVSLQVTTPFGAIYSLSTADGRIKEVSRGIYSADFSNTAEEGTYALLVSATGLYVDTLMQSGFDVRQDYPFEILRGAPMTTDPWREPFESDILVVPNSTISNYSITERIPASFSILNAGGASLQASGNETLLTWTGLTGTSRRSYLVLPPLITPELYALGPIGISYFDAGQKLFFEARAWLLAVDPLFGMFFEDAEDNWGCQELSGFTGWNATTDCDAVPWGDFNFCMDNSGDYQFCTTQDGQEGTHTTYSIKLSDWDSLNLSQGLCYSFNSTIYDDIVVSGYVSADALDNGEYCLAWVRDSDSTGNIFQCNNGDACEANNNQPVAADFTFFTTNLSTLAGIDLTEQNISVCIGAEMSLTNEFCFWDVLNITAVAIPPQILNLTYPANEYVINSTNIIQFNFSVNASRDSILPNCSLWGNFSGVWEQNATLFGVLNATITNISENISDGYYIWNIVCYTRAGVSDFYDSNYTLVVDANPPVKSVVSVDYDIVSPWVATSPNPYVNISLNKNGSCRISIQNKSYAEMIDDVNCTGAGTNLANCTYLKNPLAAGNYWFYVACNSTAGNADSNSTNLAVNITIISNSTVAMSSPGQDISVNESDYSNAYNQSCAAFCNQLPENCTDVTLHAQYNSSGSFQNINTTTTQLTANFDEYYCGNMTTGTNCTFTFTITSGAESGNNTWPIRCVALGNHSPFSQSGEINLTINDHPYPNITNPSNASWVFGIVEINASASFDSDGAIVNYLFEYDNDSAFPSPSVICNTGQSNCSWNTSSQDQCSNASMSCYLRLVATDDKGLASNEIILLGFQPSLFVTAVRVEDNTTLPINELDLVAAGTSKIGCNISVTNTNNYTNILAINATLYYSGVSFDSENDNRTHYTNDTCTMEYGSGDDATYICNFDVHYFAANGTWACMAQVWNNYTLANLTDNTTLNQLFALNISSDIIDYASLPLGAESQNISVNISNVGNVPINITVYGFGGEDPNAGGDLAMICTVNNISVGFQRFSTTVVPYDSKVSLSSMPVDLGLTIPPQENETDVKRNETYWQLKVPASSYSFGQCNGSIVFSATIPN